MDAKDTTAAVEERPGQPQPQLSEADIDDMEGQEYEFEFETPFGKIEFEVQPKPLFDRKEKQRKEKEEREAAKKARAEKRRLQAMGIPEGAEVVIVKRSNWLPILTIFVLIVVAIAVAYWLFGRPEEHEDEVPAEFLAGDPNAAIAAATNDAQPKGIVARLKHALREGRHASKEAQDEQMQRFRESTKS
jgi:Fe2+ transport system protein FeoA